MSDLCSLVFQLRSSNYDIVMLLLKLNQELEISNLHGHGQGSRTDQSLTEITPSWLHKGGLSHCLGMHVTHEVGGAPVPSHLMLRHQLPLKSGLKGLGKSLPN